MSLLRFVALLALAFWTGGLAALGGLGAPALFETLQAQDPVRGREMAGLVFGTIFTRFQFVSWGLGLLVLISLGTRAALGPRPRRFGWRMWIAAGMLAASLVTTLVVAPRIAEARDAVAAAPGVAEAADQTASLRRMHGLASGLMLATLVAGIGLIWTEMKDPH